MPDFTVTFNVAGRVVMDIQAGTEEEAIRLAETSWQYEDVGDSLYQDGAAKVKKVMKNNWIINSDGLKTKLPGIEWPEAKQATSAPGEKVTK